VIPFSLAVRHLVGAINFVDQPIGDRMKAAARHSLLTLVFVSLCTLPLAAQSPATPADARHDFDFHFGKFTTHISRLDHPLTGSTTWSKLEGTVTTRPILDGSGNLEELEAGNASFHFKGITLFLYNSDSHQWTQTFTASDGVLGHPMYGSFKNGRGEFYDQEDFNGRMILVRFTWFDITPDSHKVEQAFSDDGGKTWEPNFVATLNRVKP
jgi:hypothetical protein